VEIITGGALPGGETVPESAPAEEEDDSQEEASSNAAPLLEALPQDMTVTVVNSMGEVQALVTQEAADAIATSDPIWCPLSQAPTPGANGCTQSFSSFSDLLAFIAGNAAYQGPGTIYVQQGAYQGNESTIDFNDYNLSNIVGSDLAIVGGWNPSDGTVNPINLSTFDNVSLIIGSATNPWGGSLTINNLSITDPNQTGIVLYSGTDINLNNVSVINSTVGAGAELDAGNDVNINNSTFERNKTAGAIITAGADVAIANSSFSNPETARRQIVGVDILAGGSVSLFNVLANHNRDVGAHIEAGGSVAIANSVFSGTKAIRGGEFFGYGLTVVSDGDIALNNVEANDNFLWGAWLDALGNVSIANSVFNGNTTESPGFIDDTGLLVFADGDVSLNNVQANENRLIGATIEAGGDVAINNSVFSNNNGELVDGAGNPTFYGYGLSVVTPGSIFLDGVTASGNTLFGASLDAGVDVAVSNSNFSNNTTGSADAEAGFGLEVISGGNVLMDNVVLDNNQTFGADIVLEGNGGVFLDAITATNNGANGVQVQTNCGMVFLINGNYSNNGGYGLSVLNSSLNQSGAPVFGGNVTGDIFHDPGTCVFTPATPPTPPAPPVDEGGTTPNPTSPAAIGEQAVRTSFRNAVSGSQGLFKTMGGTLSARDVVTLNSYLANVQIANGGTHIGLFIGKYAYVHSDKGLQIVVFVPGSLNEVALNGS
jgi:hypothetical protein